MVILVNPTSILQGKTFILQGKVVLVTTELGVWIRVGNCDVAIRPKDMKPDLFFAAAAAIGETVFVSGVPNTPTPVRELRRTEPGQQGRLTGVVVGVGLSTVFLQSAFGNHAFVVAEATARQAGALVGKWAEIRGFAAPAPGQPPQMLVLAATLATSPCSLETP